MKKAGAAPDLLLNQLINRAVSRQLCHETVNFIANIDLVGHGLKNERVSPRGEKILRLLAGEKDRIKPLIRYYRRFFSTLEIYPEMHDAAFFFDGALLHWQGKNNMPPLHVNTTWPAGAAVILANAGLIRKAVFLILDVISGSSEKGPAIEIHGQLAQDKITAAIGSKPNVAIRPDAELDTCDPFRENGALSRVFIAKAIFEAHNGTLRCTVDKKTFEIALPLARQNPDEMQPFCDPAG